AVQMPRADSLLTPSPPLLQPDNEKSVTIEKIKNVLVILVVIGVLLVIKLASCLTSYKGRHLWLLRVIPFCFNFSLFCLKKSLPLLYTTASCYHGFPPTLLNASYLLRNRLVPDLP